jgi:hypothetical protein
MGAVTPGHATGEATIVSAARGFRVHVRWSCSEPVEPTRRTAMPYPFLSDEWLEEARKIRAEYAGKTPPIAHSVRMNLVVTNVPFGDGDIDAHLDTSSGEIHLDTGHLETQDLKVTVDYDTAKAILIEGNPQAGMQAFMAGKVKVEGDMAKLMALQAAPPPDADTAEMANRLKEITA